MKKLYSKIIQKIENLSVGTQTFIIALSIGVLVVALVAPITKNAYNEGYNNGCNETTATIRTNAINASVAEYVITNKLTGESSFQWITNTIVKFPFSKK